MKLYTSEEGTLPEDIDSECSNAPEVYSLTITTGINFNPIIFEALQDGALP